MTEQTKPSAAPRLGERLQKQGLLTSEQVVYAMQKQGVENTRLGSLLLKHGLAREYDVARELAVQRQITFVPREHFPKPEVEILEQFKREFCLQHSFLPIRRDGSVLEILIGNCDDRFVAEYVMRRTGLECLFLQGEFTQVLQYIRSVYYFTQNPIKELLAQEVNKLAGDVDRALSPDQFMDYLLSNAVSERATDVHIVPSDSSLHIFFRIDGVLRPMMALPSGLSRLVAYIKVTADMDISEQRRPQDGSFHISILDAPYAIRVSILYSESGERVVLRLLPEHSEQVALERLGFASADVRRLEKLFAKPAGLILVTGPTGSGKSTTMYSALQAHTLLGSNVLTIEDPIEYRIPGVAQTEVNRRAGYDFGNALRFFLRHDPDVILIGEIRDAETALSAVEAATTGHLVLSTLHVSSVFGVVPRLRPMGLDPQMIADNLIGVVSQRLVREICPYCRAEYPLSPEEKAWLGGGEGKDVRAWRGAGCDSCGQTGYTGRVPIYEILEVNQALADAIAENAPRETVRRLAVENGYHSLLEHAKLRARQGQTTLAEIARVLGEQASEDRGQRTD
jgi:general secretion pathway protein E